MIGLIGAGLGVASGLFDMFSGNAEKERGEKLLSEFERQELNNVYENTSISTYGSDLIREETARNSAGMVDAARSGGLRGIYGSLNQIQANNNKAYQQTSADLDRQENARQRNIASDNQRIRGLMEERDNMELRGIGQMINNGTQNANQGRRSIFSGLMGGLGEIPGLLQSTPQDNSVSSFDGFGGFGGFGGIDYSGVQTDIPLNKPRLF